MKPTISVTPATMVYLEREAKRWGVSPDEIVDMLVTGYVAEREQRTREGLRALSKSLDEIMKS